MMMMGESLAAALTDCSLERASGGREVSYMRCDVARSRGTYQYSTRDWTIEARLKRTRNSERSDRKNWCVA
jgi:hypothetical protein